MGKIEIDEWKPIPSFEEYKINKNGVIISTVRYVHSKKNEQSVPFYREKILTPHKSKGGYMCVGLGSKGNRKTVKIHRLVAMTFIPNPHNLPEVNHKDGDKTNNNVENLEWCTPSENQKHAIRNGLKPLSKKQLNLFMKNRKENSKTVKLTYPNGETAVFPSMQKCAEALNVDRSTVSKAISNNKKVKGCKVNICTTH